MKFALIFACVCALAPQAFAFQTGDGSVEGRVVSLATGAPVRHAAVTMYLSSPRPSRPGQPPQQFAPIKAETDDQGEFVFRNLAPGGYRLSAQKPGFAGGNNFPYQQDDLFYVGERQQLKDVVLKLAPQSVITGKVYDRNGEPLEYAQISLLRPQYDQSGEQWVPMNSTPTNDLGEYRIAGVSPGRYRVGATFRDYRGMPPSSQPVPEAPEMSYIATYYGDTADPAKAQAVTVNSGGEAHADIRMQMAATVRIRGRVIDPGSPTPNQMTAVNLVPKNGSVNPMFGMVISGGINRPDGSFELAGVVPGDYDLVARKGGPPPTGADMTVAVQPITVGDRSIDGIVLTLASGRDVPGTVQAEGNAVPALGSLMIQATSLDGTNSGRTPSVRGVSGSRFTLKSVPPGRTTISVNNPPQGYYVKSIRYAGKEIPPSGVDVTTGGTLEILLSGNGAMLAGRALDASGKAVPHPGIALFSAGGKPALYQPYTSDNNGEIRFPMLPPGEYKICGWESANRPYAQNIDFRQVENRSKTVKLEAGGNEVMDVTVIPAGDDAEGRASAPPLEFPRTKGSVQGQVLDRKTGAPLSNALVHLNAGTGGGMGGAMFASGGSGSAMARSRPQGQTAQTDDQGNFVFRDIEPGAYQLGAEHQGFVNGLYGVHPDMNADTLIVGEGQDLSKVAVKLTPQAVVAGKVVDEFGDAIVNAPVSVYSRVPRPGTVGNSSPARTANTNPLGEFRIAGLAAGQYILAVRPAPPLTAAELGALPLPDQPEMRYQVTYYPGSLDPAGATTIALESGATVAGIDLKLQKTASFQLRGLLTGLPPARSAATPQDPAGRPAMVSLYPAKAVAGMALPAGSVSVRRDGSFTIAGVLPGSYLLAARPAPVAESRVSAGFLPIEVKDKHLDGIQVALKAASDVTASVSWEKPTTVSLSGLFIELRSVYPTESGASGQMDGETAMTFHNILPVPYKVGTVNLPWNCYCFLKSLRYGGRDLPESGADLTTGQPLEIVLSSSAGIVEGTVVDRAGKPVGGAALALAPKGGSEAKVRTGFADDDGKFFFDNNPPGEYRLLAWEDVNPASLNDASFLERFYASATEVKLGPLGRQTVRPVAIPAK